MLTPSVRRGPASAARPSELAAALDPYRRALWSVGATSGILNILMLSGSFFMLLVYDRVIPGRSLPTLVSLLIIVAVLYAFQGVLDFIRSQIVANVAGALDVTLSPRLYDVVMRSSLRSRAQGDGLQPIRDLDQLRTFLSGSGVIAFFDLPWMVIYLGVCFLFHFLIGLTALAGVLLLVGLTVLTEGLTRDPIRAASAQVSRRNGLLDASRRNVEAAYALGMRGRLEAVWRRANEDYVKSQQRATYVTGGFGVATKTLRMLLQSCVLAVGAYLVVEQKATGGIIIASSILTARALAPIELAIANWKGFVGARQSWRRLSDLLGQYPAAAPLAELPPPTERLEVERLGVAPPGAQKLTVMGASFELSAGDAVGVIGPSASGKSSLARALVGVWPCAQGAVRLDGAALDQWDSERLGRHIGYLPQDVELIEGTVAQNLCRFEPNAPMDAIIAAARTARVHDLILNLPKGYDSAVGPNGADLSAGQKQRLALARALYGDPFLVVLDEPNSNLDSDGEAALAAAIQATRARGAVVVVIAHRPSALAGVNLALFMSEGRITHFGPRDEILSQVLRPVQSAGPGAREGVAAHA